MKIKFQILSICLAFVIHSQNIAQGSAGSDASSELRSLVDIPTAGVLESGNLGLSFEAMQYGIFSTKVELGLFKNFNLGVSYGGSKIIGTGNPDFYPMPGFHAKFRVFTETKTIPSITFGFNSQGKGKHLDSLNRYEIKSPGVYTSFSKNYKLLGYFSLHATANYSFERKDGDENINFGFGFEKTIGPTVSLVAEYDFALNDNSKNSLGDGKGYFNVGIRWAASYGLTIGLDFRNIFENKVSQTYTGPERALIINYVRNIF